MNSSKHRKSAAKSFPAVESRFAGDYAYIRFRGDHESAVGSTGGRSESTGDGDEEPARPASHREPEAVIQRLEEELFHAQEQLRTTTRKHKSASKVMSASNVEMQSINRQLESHVNKLEEQLKECAEEIRQLGSELILSEQTERERIGQILHDDMQQILYAVQMKVNAQGESFPPEQAARLAQANALIGRALEVTRTLTADLGPPVLKGESSAAMLEWLARQMEEFYNLKVKVESPGPVKLPTALCMLVYQLVRELLFNVVKHARTDVARIKMGWEDTQLVVLVEDEGAGCKLTADQEQGPAKRGGFGLQSVRQRLEIFGGSLSVRSAPGRGTRATIYVPVVGVASFPAATLPDSKQTGGVRRNDKTDIHCRG